MGAPAHQVTGVPRALTIAGSDSGGGAGIQADLKVFQALGCHGMSALTALTAQNTVEVSAIHEVPPEFVTKQIDAVVSDIGVDAAKTGMLASAPIVEAVAAAVKGQGIPNLVVDPVFVSKHRDRLLEGSAIAALKQQLLPLASVVTPNLYEAGALIGREIVSLSDMEQAAAELHQLGPTAVLVKGGHLPGDEAIDVFFTGDRMHHLRGPRFDTEDTHGTGCALSAAIAARLAHGDGLYEAAGFAKEWLSGAIDRGLRLGRGYGPVNPSWRLQL
jgi:hydroxymethylpyrimidine/phosphomethylpyrimidine kinase